MEMITYMSILTFKKSEKSEALAVKFGAIFSREFMVVKCLSKNTLFRTNMIKGFKNIHMQNT